MNFKRSFKKCEEFRICCAWGDKGIVYVEEHEKNKTLYSIQAKGSGRCAAVFSSDYIEGDEKNANFGCMKPYFGKHIIFKLTSIKFSINQLLNMSIIYKITILRQFFAKIILDI